MRRLTLAVLGLSIPAMLVAADLFASLGWEQKAFEDTCFFFVREPERLPAFHATTAMRAMAVAQRKGAVDSIGARAKAYYASEAFSKRWQEERAREGSADREAQEAQAAQMQEQNLKAMKDAIAQMEAMIPMMPPAQQEEMKKAVAKARSEQGKKFSGGRDEREDALPKDPKVALRRALQHFLSVTEGVDYGAALSIRDGRKFFSRADLEAKSPEWKMVFRAGREAGEGARSYVRAWIAELK